MRSSLITAVGVALAASVAGAQSSQPNIILIMADDLGWSDTSNGLTNLGNPSDFYETPTLERLAVEGMAFTNAYTSGPNCAPTRAAMLTGQYATRPTNNVYQVGDLNRGGGGTLLVGPPQGLPNGTDAVPAASITYAEMLQDAGYQTAHFGKFHVTGTGSSGAAQIVSEHGFHANFGGTTSGAPGAYHASGAQFASNVGPALDAYAADYTQEYVDTNIKPFAVGTSTAAINALVGTDKHLSDAAADAAIAYMEQENGSPFFLQYNPHAVHSPIGNTQARSDLLNKYQSKPPGQVDSNAAFGALIEGLDQSVARLVDYLETTPDPRNPGQTLDQNTLVVFYSDNGGRDNWSNNGPLKGEKGELTEGGVRVPMIAWSGNPSLVDGGTVNHTPVASIDFYPTLASLAGADAPLGWTLDGEDLSGLFSDDATELGREALYWHLPGYLVDGDRNQHPQSVVRSGDWKLLYNYEDQSYELYNLTSDISESTNLAADNPGVVANLGRMLMNWLVETDAPLATLRSGQLTLGVTGWAYADGAVTFYEDEILTIDAGEEAPLLLSAFLNEADLNSDGEVNAQDWLLFRSGQERDLSGMSQLEAFRLGDIDNDGDNDIVDFVRFKNAFDFSNGAGAFQALLAVPEPSGIGIVVSAVGAASGGVRGERGGTGANVEEPAQ